MQRETGGGPGPSVSEMNDMLVMRADALVRDLLPLGRQKGQEWVEASTAKGGLGDSLMVRLRGTRAGVWSHFAAGKSGDLIDLIAYVRCGGDLRAAVQWAKGWLGLADAGGAGAARMAETLARARAAAAARAKAAAAEAEKRAGRAKAMWLAAQPAKAGDVVDDYLRQRGVGLAALGRVPGALRMSPSLRHGSDAPGEPGWPAMLAAIVDGEGRHVATHRTWLTPEGRKAPVAPVKAVLGDYAGGHIPLWKGRFGEPMHRLRAGVPVYVSEGIEDGLSVARLMPEARVVACVSLGNLAALALPDTVTELVVVGQNDPETLPDGRPHPAAVALKAAIERHAEAGRTVRLARPPAPHKDFNDWVRALDAAVREVAA